MKSPFNLLALLIPDLHAPERDIDIFLEPLIEELQYLWEEGCEMYDYVARGIFRMHVALLWIVNNFFAYGDISRWCIKGYKACPTCNDDIILDRIHGKIYFTDHRYFLSDDHRWRKSLKFNDKYERHTQPRFWSTDNILNQLSDPQDVIFGKSPANQVGVWTSIEN